MIDLLILKAFASPSDWSSTLISRAPHLLLFTLLTALTVALYPQRLTLTMPKEEVSILYKVPIIMFSHHFRNKTSKLHTTYLDLSYISNHK
jgi:hypothetical protein